MQITKVFFPILAIITLLLVACSSSTGGVDSAAQVSSPDPTATQASIQPPEAEANPEASVSSGTSESSGTVAVPEGTAIPEPTTKPEPTPAPQPAMTETEAALISLATVDMGAVSAEVMNSPR